MRVGLLALSLAMLLLGGGTCLPLIDETDRTPLPGTALGVAIDDPDTATSVAAGDNVSIAWSASNQSGKAALVTVLVESRVNLLQTILADELPANDESTKGSVIWNTTGFSGEYAIRARISNGESTTETLAASRVTVLAPPTFRFIEPTSDQVFRPGGSLTIRWNGGGATASVRLGLDPDADHANGNEVFILERALPATAADDSFNWTGNQQDGTTAVAAGQYALFARVTDDANDAQVFAANVQIDVRADANELEITAPSTDTVFLTSEPTLTIEFRVERSSESLADIKVDADNDHANGNEITILSQRLIPANSTGDTFGWNGNDTNGTPVPPGIYKLVLLASSGSGNPASREGPALVMRRDAADQPLIALLAPATATTVNTGQFVNLSWRDDDPGETATIRLVIDDDRDPNEATETGAAETTILTGRSAKDDGVQDTFSFQIPGTLAPGTYFVFAYIDRDGAAPFDNISVAPAPLIVRDPAATP